MWTPEEIDASPFGWPPVDFDEESSEDEEDDEAQRMIDEQQRRREERSQLRSSRALSDPASPSSPTHPGSSTLPALPTPESNGTTAARTFLIYVIGGYYPPDHTIVTGGLENFESFEALLELAEMLGHAKPPTVTREEIEKSGLETIKPAMLSVYEDQGRVSYNCIERVSRLLFCG